MNIDGEFKPGDLACVLKQNRKSVAVYFTQFPSAWSDETLDNNDVVTILERSPSDETGGLVNVLSRHGVSWTWMMYLVRIVT